MIHFSQRKKQLLGQLLLKKNLITQEQLEEALKKQKEMGELLGMVLLELGYLDHESQLLPIVAEQFGVHYVDLHQMEISSDVIEKIPLKVAKRYNIMPVDYHDDVLRVAMTKPNDILLQDEIQMVVDGEVEPVLAGRNDIVSSIKKHYGIGADTIEEIMKNATPREEKKDDLSDLDIEGKDSEATIANYLNQVFLQAYKDRATDIHIEPFKKEIIIRYRVDGILQDIHVPENIAYFKDSIVSRIKILSNLNIAEKRMPQDGRFRVHVGDVKLDLRVSFLPTPYGESAVIRILNSTRLFSFDELDLTKEGKEILIELINQPHGVIFMTGPTGSGKTTTLYSCLSRINTVDRKIITIEDPVEYQLRNITQIQVNPSIQLSFARGLRSILRHDPDVIMVGEVRDIETAEIAIQVALTGHLIFSTLHTNDAAGGVTRLLNMGVEPYLITSTVNCFIAQRLVRVICPKCKEKRKLNSKLIKEFKPQLHSKKDEMVFFGKGCEACNHTGYKDRTGIFEFLLLNDELNDMILSRETAGQIKKKAMASGMKTLRQAGWEKIQSGITTPEEVIRVTQGRSRRK